LRSGYANGGVVLAMVEVAKKSFQLSFIKQAEKDPLHLQWVVIAGP